MDFIIVNKERGWLSLIAMYKVLNYLKVIDLQLSCSI